MRMPLLSNIAVLTGDLMQSTVAEPSATERAMQDLSNAAGEVAHWVGADTRFTRFRGDGWQIVLTGQTKLALRAAVYMIAMLKARKGGLHTRISVATGDADNLGTSDLSDARGNAFTRSGRALDQMKPGLLHAEFTGIRPIHLGFMDLLEPLLWRWTPEQAEAVGLSLSPMATTQKDIARRLEISDQAVSYRLRGANADALHNALTRWEADFAWKMTS
jgi:hypothetical protein